MSKTTIIWVGTVLVVLTGSGVWLWSRFGPSQSNVYQEQLTVSPVAVTLNPASNLCDLTVRRYKQIGTEMQFELAANVGGLAPYDVEISQNGNIQRFANIPHHTTIWLTLPDIKLTAGKASIRVISLGQKGCETTASFEFDGSRKDEIPDQSRWIRQGSKDNWLDVRPVQKDGKIYLKDFANYQDGRTKVVMIDGIAVNGLENGIEVKPGYLYSVTGRWIDAPYNDWWNNLRNRSVRQQNIWISADQRESGKSSLTKIEIPSWFAPSRGINVDFDTKFPEFQPVAGKLVMQFRLNEWVSTDNYFNRGVRYLNGWEGKVPTEKLHLTSTPNFFGDQDEKWFGSLSKQEVEKYADYVPDFSVYAFDYEFWNQHYPPDVKQRLIWFTQRIKQNHPKIQVFDYWGGGPYANPHISKTSGNKPMDFVKDYSDPKPNHTNFDKLPNGDSFQNLYTITPTDVYPKPMFAMDEQGNTANNFVLLSAIHSLRINKLIPFQKNNKFIFYGWNRYMPLYKDPIVPWNLQTTDPKGELVLNQLEMMPASQALSMSLFSLILFDGYYLWHDSGPYGNDPNRYYIPKDGEGWGKEWYPADSKTAISAFKETPGAPGTPSYWDFPTAFYVLGNWMAKQVEDVLTGGVNQDLAIEIDGVWQEPKTEQVLLAADKKIPFVSAIVNGNKIAVIGVDCFQSPTATRKLKIRLPDRTETTIEMYGNWPVLYRGTLKK